MSTDTERVEETETSFLETLENWYHIPAIGAVILFMFWVRIQAYDNFVTEDGSPALGAVDSWYHWRTIEWTAENYPQTMPYDVWTGFPTGRYVGQFGTLFDQIIVTVAMIVGLGNPSTETLYTVSLIMIPLMAALVAIPVFYLGRRLGGTLGGLVSIVILALAPGQFLQRTTVGQLQHHVAEVLFMAIAVLAFMVALRAAEQEQPIYELVADKDWETLRTPAIYSALAGIALSLYIWVWPPGVVLIGILAIFFTVQLCLDYVRNISPDHVAFVGAISLGITAIVTALLIEEPGTSVTSFGYLQPASAALVAIGCVFMAWFARQWNAYDIDRRLYPAAIGGLIVAVFGAMWLVLPDLFSTIVSNATRRVIPFGEVGTDLTIQEAQPPADFTDHVINEFGAAFYTMLVGLVLLVARPFFGREYRTEHTLVIVWALFLTSMAATQIRFAYYLVLAVAVVNAIFVAEIARLVDLDVMGSLDSVRQVEAYQVIVLVMVVMLLFAPLLPPIAASGTTAWDRTDGVEPSGSSQVWESSNHWMAENTPEPGNWGDNDNAEQLELYGTYNYPADGNYDYPDGTYGVMSWWDYGHLITTQAERIPHSNPFQQNADSSSAFLTAQSEERGELILDAIATGESVSEQSNEELEDIVANADDSGEDIRYVMIDDQMAAGKFSAITEWTGPDYGEYVTPESHEEGEPIPAEELEELTPEMPYYQTMQSQLYFNDGVGMDHYRLVHENEGQMAFTSFAFVNPDTGEVHTDDIGDLIDQAMDPEASVESDDEWDPQIIMNERGTPQQIQQQYAWVQQFPQIDIQIFDARQAGQVKTYERVEGATLTGSVDVDDTDEATVSAAVEVDPGTEREAFDYVQQGELDEDGNFEMTVSYATNDELGVEDGYTDSSVEAVEDYSVTVTAPDEDGGFSSYEANTSVPETDVVTGGTIDVDLEEVEFDDVEDIENETDAGEDADVEIDDEMPADEPAEDEPVEDEEVTGGDADAAESFEPVAVDAAG
ncbi:oligosaccharyl transferase, archaeosortase A system-associated [Natrialbaceae archaeon A-arb3/5]